MPNPTHRLENLLQLARGAVYREDRVALYSTGKQMCYQARRELGATLPCGLRPDPSAHGDALTALDHHSLTWTFYTSRWYWLAANHYRMGIRDLRFVPGKGKRMGIWLTKDMAAKASRFTTQGKARGDTAPSKDWHEWWQSFKAVHRDINDILVQLRSELPVRKAAGLWGNVFLLLERCRLAAERGAVWPKEVVRMPEEPATKPRAVVKAVPVAKMVKKGRPNRVSADGQTRWRFSRSYRAVAETLNLGELDPNGKHVWLAEGLFEHTVVATAVKAKNANISIALEG